MKKSMQMQYETFLLRIYWNLAYIILIILIYLSLRIYIEISIFGLWNECPARSQVNLRQEFILSNVEQFRRMC